MRVLVVEDDPEVYEFLVNRLIRANHEGDHAGTVAVGLERARTGAYDVIVLDVGLPDGDGFELVGRLRAGGDATPVLMLTAHGDEEDVVRGLSDGADDYLTKPFSMTELIARLEALARRRRMSSANVLVRGPVELDLIEHALRYTDVSVGLTDKEFRLLRILLEAEGEVITHEDLLSDVWGMDFDPGTGVVKAQVTQLRAKLDRAGIPVRVENVKGVGYRIPEDPPPITST